MGDINGANTAAQGLSEEKLAEAKEIFELYDKDGDKRISTQELGNVMRALGANPTLGELQEMIREVDSNGNGTVDFSEFITLFMTKLKEPDTEADLIETFKMFDKDENGCIRPEELREALMKAGSKLTEEEADEMVREADIDGDGFINYREFVRIMMTK